MRQGWPLLSRRGGLFSALARSRPVHEEVHLPTRRRQAPARLRRAPGPGRARPAHRRARRAERALAARARTLDRPRTRGCAHRRAPPRRSCRPTASGARRCCEPSRAPTTARRARAHARRRRPRRARRGEHALETLERLEETPAQGAPRGRAGARKRRCCRTSCRRARRAAHSSAGSSPMTIADVTSSIQAIEQRIASISPSAAQVFATPIATTGAARPRPPRSRASSRPRASIRPRRTTSPTLPDLLPTTDRTLTTIAPLTTMPTSAPASTDTTQYDSLIQQAARDQGVDPALLKGLVQAESGFNPNAVSSVGAQGLTQLMPAPPAVSVSRTRSTRCRTSRAALASWPARSSASAATSSSRSPPTTPAPAPSSATAGSRRTPRRRPTCRACSATPTQYRAAGLRPDPGARPRPPGRAAGRGSDGKRSSPPSQSAPSAAAQHAIEVASQYLGTPYHFGGASPQTGFDCSGLAQYAYGQSGVSLPARRRRPVQRRPARRPRIAAAGRHRLLPGLHRLHPPRGHLPRWTTSSSRRRTPATS